MPYTCVQVFIPKEMESSLLLATCLETTLTGLGLLEYRFNASSLNFSPN